MIDLSQYGTITATLDTYPTNLQQIGSGCQSVTYLHPTFRDRVLKRFFIECTDDSYIHYLSICLLNESIHLPKISSIKVFDISSFEHVEEKFHGRHTVIEVECERLFPIFKPHGVSYSDQRLILSTFKIDLSICKNDGQFLGIIQDRYMHRCIDRNDHREHLIQYHPDHSIRDLFSLLEPFFERFVCDIRLQNVMKRRNSDGTSTAVIIDGFDANWHM